jgi:phosphatidylcholine synthase
MSAEFSVELPQGIGDTTDGQSPKARRRRRLYLKRFLAWCIHFYTALGLVAAAGIAVLIAQPEANAESFRWAFVLMLVATLIDATDGTLARKIRIKEVLPGFDGRRLDDLVDFLTYTCLPLLLLWRSGIVAPYEWCLLGPLLASAYGFCQVSIKTDDGYFLGFPSYWNLIAFYLYFLQPPVWLSLTLLWTFALLTFVPARYLYTTMQRGVLNQLINVLGVFWGALVVWILFAFPAQYTRWLLLVSLLYPAFYLAASWWISLRLWRRRSIIKEARG